MDLTTGFFHRSLEATNPPLAMIGFEKGVEPLLWTTAALLVPVDDERGHANLFSIDKDANIFNVVEDSIVNPSTVILGFERSVDPIVMALPNVDRTLYVPVEKQDQSDANLMVFTTPPTFAVATRRNFEALNESPVSGYERDVHAIRVNRADGYAYLYVAEENPAHTAARLRIHDLPTSPNVLLVLPTENAGAVPAPNLFLVTPNGVMVQQNPDVIGYELGVHPTSAVHDTRGLGSTIAHVAAARVRRGSGQHADDEELVLRRHRRRRLRGCSRLLAARGRGLGIAGRGQRPDGGQGGFQRRSDPLLDQSGCGRGVGHLLRHRYRVDVRAGGG